MFNDSDSDSNPGRTFYKRSNPQMEYFTQRGLPIPGRGQTGLKGHSCGGAVGKKGAPALGRELN